MALSVPYIIVIVVGGIIILAILPFLFTAIYIFFAKMWLLIEKPQTYREWNRLRKEWNKTAAIERRRLYIAILLLEEEGKKQGLSQEDLFYYAAIV